MTPEIDDHPSREATEVETSDHPQPILSVRDLVVEFESESGPLRAIDGVSLDVFPDEVLGIVGESGSGKSLTMLAVMGLLPGGGRIVGGSIEFRGRDMVAMANTERRQILGKEMAMIFQDPMTSLNPVIKVGKQIAEMIRIHERNMSRADVTARVVELLELVRIPKAAASMHSYPHEFSGGMRQRAMIAMAVAHNPALLIADEPTTALDVTIQAQVLRVLANIRREVGASMTLISHDLGVVAQAADRIVVLYGGRVMETGTVEQIFLHSRHPYTVGLLAGSLGLDTPVDFAYAIPGQPPSIDDRPSGCVFRPRCGLQGDRAECEAAVPMLVGTGQDPRHRVACHFHTETRQWAEVSGALTVAPSDAEPPS